MSGTLLDLVLARLRARRVRRQAAAVGGNVPVDARSGWSTLTTIGGVEVEKDDRGRVRWSSGMAIDADGSPRAYGPSGTSPLDNLGNAGSPGRWWGVVTDDAGNPLVQGASDPAPGYYVSPTAMVVPGYQKGDPRRYLDSEKVPYVAVPRELLSAAGAAMGDLCLVSYNGAQSWAVLGDVGPAGKLGEGSIALAVALGIPSSARSGGVSSGVSWLLYPGSGGGLDRARIAAGEVAGLAAERGLA